ncbi:hypothetical protein AB664_24855 [Brucella anthropi]|uniref:Uncharacterized protein n=1 Tax=Brucella anthropi TaxID=529 RepID=A0A656Z6C0_BRUAN|nr:hypothetical protein AB664_24855 [Brucella anthropi]
MGRSKAAAVTLTAATRHKRTSTQISSGCDFRLLLLTSARCSLLGRHGWAAKFQLVEERLISQLRIPQHLLE